MLGHAEEWFYRGPGGINIDFTRKGAGRLVFRPETVGDLAWVRTRYQSALGLVESSWMRRPTNTTYDFNIPVNSTGTIEVNAASPKDVTVNGAPMSMAKGVISVKQVARRIQIVANSGHYHVYCLNPSQ